MSASRTCMLESVESVASRLAPGGSSLSPRPCCLQRFRHGDSVDSHPSELGVYDLHVAQVHVAQATTRERHVFDSRASQVGVGQANARQLDVAQPGARQVGVFQLEATEVHITDAGIRYLGIAHAQTRQIHVCQFRSGKILSLPPGAPALSGRWPLLLPPGCTFDHGRNRA